MKSILISPMPFVRRSVFVKKFFFFLFILLFETFALAQIHGERGPATILSAWNLPKGYLTITPQTRLFVNALDQNQTSSERSQKAIRNASLGFSMNWGLSQRLEASITPVIYQDTQIGKGSDTFNLPDDLFLNLKMAIGKRADSRFKLAAQLGARLPIGKNHNIPLEPYSTDRLSFGATGIASIGMSSIDPLSGVKLHLNLGYWNYNDAGATFTDDYASLDTLEVKRVSQELFYGLAFIIPTRAFDFRLQLFGRRFISKPPVTAYSREPVVYVSPGISFASTRWLSFAFSTDIRLTGNNDETEYRQIPVLPAGVPNYPPWQIKLGIKLAVLPFSLYSSASEEELIHYQETESRRELFEKILQEKLESENAFEEIEEIRDQRKQAEREIKYLRDFIRNENANSDKEKSEENGEKKEEPPQ